MKHQGLIWTASLATAMAVAAFAVPKVIRDASEMSSGTTWQSTMSLGMRLILKGNGYQTSNASDNVDFYNASPIEPPSTLQMATPRRGANSVGRFDPSNSGRYRVMAPHRHDQQVVLR